jgi:hypothetical protein
MNRRSFYIGLGSGIIIGALMMLIITIGSPISTSVSTPVPVPSAQVLISATRASWQVMPPQKTPSVPPGAVPFEFNGQTYYLVPLNSQA